MLCIGGPADGKRIEVDKALAQFKVAINPQPPAFTPDTATMQQEEPRIIYATYEIDRLSFFDSAPIYFAVFKPENDSMTQPQRLKAAIEELFKQYPDKTATRFNYINQAQGKLFENDDRDPRSRLYSV